MVEVSKLNFRRLSFWKVVFAILFLAIPGFILPSKLVIGYGDSVKYTLFWKVSKDEFSYDDYVVLKMPKEDPFAKGMNIVKRIGCKEGDELLIEGKAYYCLRKGEREAIFLGEAKERSRTGVKVNQFNPCGDNPCRVGVPSGHFFVIGDHKDSYDSRYFGWVPYERVVVVAKPIF
jgi:signal peptidase I/conjugal transfer pilin signal peptidase TrbI